MLQGNGRCIRKRKLQGAHINRLDPEDNSKVTQILEDIDEIQFGFMPGCRTTNTFLFWDSYRRII